MDNDLYSNLKIEFLDFRGFYYSIFMYHKVFLFEHTEFLNAIALWLMYSTALELLEIKIQ